ncbi:hypothetical protein AOL_s00006g444 [Orbilia oligospora ATCC 24927]|uniref:Uncharacterized protein n=1 Tax=Arthrobotrys oligospora (strain ATCC 24927 / CBS 115.81 / DSM 1491) TaxID=756982 RepID=G1X0P3_ARTOA|nr:hypothetical protein AOL_s00006g444 [Orbilia oligospora ATCC 24927]EGX53578.1 hypothetical protein AOL_s00006g444 [Orbilia oligospora ATCC 24927]
MQPRALRVLLIGIGLVVQTSSIPLCHKTKSTSNLDIEDSHTLAEVIRAPRNRATAPSSKKAASKIDHIEEQQQPRKFTLYLFNDPGQRSPTVGISTPRLSTYPAKLVDDDKLGAAGNPKDVESLLDCHEALDSEEGSSKLKDLEGSTNSNTGSLEMSGFLIHKRDVSDANSTATATTSLTITAVPNPASVLDGTSVSTPSLVPTSLEASVSSTSLPTSDQVDADEGKSHISNISLRVDVPPSYFISGKMVIECRSSEANYQSSRNTEPRWAFLDWPNFQEYASRDKAMGSITRRTTSLGLEGSVRRGSGVRHACAIRRAYPEECALVYGCYCTAQLHDNPDAITGASVADYQQALDNLPETIKNSNEGFRFNAGARVGGLDNWITFTDALRLYPTANRPGPFSGFEFIAETPPPTFQRTKTPGSGRVADPLLYVDEDDPEIDEAGFQNWFGPGNNNFGYPEPKYRGSTSHLKGPRDPNQDE